MTIPSLLSQRVIVSPCPIKSFQDPLDCATTLVQPLSPIDCTSAKKLLISVSCPYWFQYSLHTAISLILLKYTTFICYLSAQIPSETQCGKVRLHCLAFKILIIYCYLYIFISFLMWPLSSVCPKQSSSYSRGSVCIVSPFEMFFPSLKQFYSSFKVFSQESFYGNFSLFSEFWYHLQWGFRI